MSWLLITLLTPACFAVTNFMDKFLVERTSLTGIQLTILLSWGIGGAGVLIGALNGLTPLPIFDIAMIMLAGLAVSIYMWPYFIALSRDETSRVVPLFQFSSLMLIAFSWFALGEKLTANHILGAAAIILGGFALSAERSVTGVFKLRPAFWFMMLSSFIYALSGVLIRFVVSNGASPSAFFFQGIGIALGGLLLFLLNRRSSYPSIKSGAPLMIFFLCNVIISVVAIYGEVYAMSMVEANRVRTIHGVQPLFVFIMGCVLGLKFPGIFKEDLSRTSLTIKASVGALMLLGIALIYR